MNKVTKTTGIAAAIGAVVAGLAVIAGKVAATKDSAAKETEDVFDNIGNEEIDDEEIKELLESENIEEAETEPEEV